MHRVRVRVSLSLKCKVNEKRTQLLPITLYQLAGPVSEEGEGKRGKQRCCLISSITNQILRK